MKTFKAVFTTNQNEQVSRNQKINYLDLPFELRVQIDKNNQIYDVTPHNLYGIDLLSKYRGRTADWVNDLIYELTNAY